MTRSALLLAMVSGLAVTPCLATTADAAAAEPSQQEFGYKMQIFATGDAPAYRLSLPLAVYQKTARTDLGDLRVFNADGEVVPYSLEHPVAGVTVAKSPRPLPLFGLKDDSKAALDALRVTIDSGKAQVNIRTAGGEGPGNLGAPAGSHTTAYLIDGRAVEAATSALLLEWPDEAPDFAGRVRVEASDDLADWRTVSGAAPIANLHAGVERLIERRIELPPTQPKFWRLTWVGTAAPFVLTSVLAEPAREQVDAARTSLDVPGLRAGSDIEFDLGGHAPIDRVNVELPEMNSVIEIDVLSRLRPTDTWRTVLHKGFYRLSSGGTELSNAAVPIEIDSDRYWLIRADARGGGLGKGTPRLSVGWVAHQVVFLARGARPFTLTYGSATATPAGVSLTTIPKSVAIAEASLGPLEKLGGDARLLPPPPPLPWKTWLLWGILVAGAALLAWMAYRLSRDFGKTARHE